MVGRLRSAPNERMREVEQLEGTGLDPKPLAGADYRRFNAVPITKQPKSHPPFRKFHSGGALHAKCGLCMGEAPQGRECHFRQEGDSPQRLGDPAPGHRPEVSLG